MVFLLICLVYLSSPSSHFNADALHYNLHAFLSAREPSRFLTDSSVPAHLGWHVLATSLLMILRPETPEQSLYMLVTMNIALALGSIYLFMRIVGSYAGNRTTIWATLCLAFSHAFLRYSLTVEVYSLNNLVLAGVLLAVHTTARARGAPRSRWTAIHLAVLTAAALGAHITNVLLVPPILVLLLRGGTKQALRSALTYAAGLVSVLLAGLLGLALVGGQDLRGIMRFLLSYDVDTHAYVETGMLSSLRVALRSFADALVPGHGLWLFLPAVFFILYSARRWGRLKSDPWIGFLVIYAALVGTLVCLWDPSNLEHKIALMLPLLLLLTSVVVQLGDRLHLSLRTGAWLLALGVVVFGVKDGALPYSDIGDYVPYRISTEIHARTASSKVLVVADERRLEMSAVALSSMTFFGQQVTVLGPDDPGLEEKIRLRQGDGFEVVWLSAPSTGEP